MTLPSSGTITHSMIQNEMGGPAPVALGEYYGSAPGLPVNGDIANTDFYGITRIFQTVITVGVRGNKGWAERRGFSLANKTTFLHPEAGQSFAAFGSSSVTQYVLGGYDLYGIHAGRDDPRSRDRWVIITGSNPRGVPGNWTYIRARRVGNTAWAAVVDREQYYTAYGSNSLGFGYLLFSVKEQNSSNPVHNLWSLLWSSAGTQIEIEFI
jgi:hypothetical protein